MSEQITSEQITAVQAEISAVLSEADLEAVAGGYYIPTPVIEVIVEKLVDLLT